MMTNSISPDAPLPFAAPAANDKSRAFHAAARHSRRVRLLRRGIFVGVFAVIAGVVLFTVYDPLHKTVAGVSVDGVRLNGTKVTMSHPHLSGYRNDGRPYEISASSAVQDIKSPTKVELHDITATLTMQDKTVTHVDAKVGLYDSQRDLMDLNSEVHIVSDGGLDARTVNAHVAFKSGSLNTDNPVTVAMRGNTIAADSMRLIDGGKQVTFIGHVRTTFLPGEARAARTADQASAP